MILMLSVRLLGAWLTTIINSGGPAWLNPLALLCAWNTIKFAWVAVASTAASARRVIAHPLRSHRRAEFHGA